MRTYQDLQEQKTDKERMGFVIEAINEHKTTDLYKTAVEAEEYAKQKNVTISEYRKLLYTLSGEAVADNFSANHKCASNFFDRFITQEVQYLLGNGCVFEEKETKEKLGGDEFDITLQKGALWSLIGGVAFGMFDIDHIQFFKVTEFVPLIDEEDGSMKAGIRFWQIADNKPLRCTLYELDGYTDFIRRNDEDIKILHEKRAYIVNEASTAADGVIYEQGENYPTFPIVPLWANPYQQSEIVGIREEIDCYDLIKSGFANDLDDASQIYWTIKNAGGMDDIDLVKFVERLKTVKAAVVDDSGSQAEAHTIELPYQAREAALTRLEKDLYKDFKALDTEQIAAGNVTATQIEAAYEPLNEKCDMFEFCIRDFIKGIFAIIGVDDNPTFTRSQIVNATEITQMVLQSAQYLDDDTIVDLLPFLTPEQKEEVKKLNAIDQVEMFKEETQPVEEQPAIEEDETE